VSWGSWEATPISSDENQGEHLIAFAADHAMIERRVVEIGR